MSDSPDNLVLALLRRLDAKLDKVSSDMIEVKERLGFLEGSYANASRRIDQIDARLERLERRLDLVQA